MLCNMSNSRCYSSQNSKTQSMQFSAVFYKITTAEFGLTPSSFYRVTADEILTARLIKLFTKNLQVKLNCNLRLIHMPRNFTKKSFSRETFKIGVSNPKG